MKLISIDSKKIFHYISYLQYPIMVVATYYYYLFIKDLSIDFNHEALNNILTFLGVALSFSTLQDTTKTQNKLSLRVWQNPKWGSLFLLILTIMAFLVLGIGLLGLLNVGSDGQKDLSIGCTVFGIGLIGLIKTAKEMFENHRLDKNPLPKLTEE